MIERIKQATRKVIRLFAVLLNKASGGAITPNSVTIFGAVMHIPIAVLIASRHTMWAASLLLIFGLFDTLDGELARLQQTTSTEGRLLDSITDRMKEIMLYVGAGYAIIVTTGRPYLAVWAIAACGSSLLTSYINAAGDAVMNTQDTHRHVVNKAFRGGLLPFEIRMFVLLVGLVSNHLSPAVIVITIGASLTAIDRLLRVLRRVAEVNA